MTLRRLTLTSIALLACSLPSLARAEPSSPTEPSRAPTLNGLVATIIGALEKGATSDTQKQIAPLAGEAMEKQGHVPTSIGLATMVLSVTVLVANARAHVDSETSASKPTDETLHIDATRAPEWRGAGWSAPRPKAAPMLTLRF